MADKGIPDGPRGGQAAEGSAPHGRDQPADPDHGQLRLAHLGRWLPRIATTAAVLALVGVIVEGVLVGLEFSTMVRWAGGFVVVTLLAAAVAVAAQAYRAARAAQRRGERLSSPDVGMVPPRRRPGRRG